MPQSLAETYFHIVFSTKDRAPFLRDRALRNELHTYLGGTCRNLQSPSLIVGGALDHVHILCRFGRTITTADLIKGLKKESSKWIKGALGVQYRTPLAFKIKAVPAIKAPANSERALPPTTSVSRQ